MLHWFTLDELQKLDAGRVPEAWAQALTRCAEDCEDRPNLDKPRKVTMEAELVPVADCQGAEVRCVGIKGLFKIREKVPTRESRVYSFGVRRVNGQTKLFFSDEDPNNVEQTTVFDERDEKGRVVRGFGPEDADEEAD